MNAVAERRKRVIAVFAALFLIVLIFLILDLAQAFIPLSFEDAFLALFGIGSDMNVKIVQQTNLPRVIMACLVGAGLGIAGAVMQAIFRNPMASPYILGLSSGASLGAAIGLTITVPFIPQMLLVPLLAFITCMATLFIVYSISHVGGRVPTETLLLAGIAVGSFMSALVSFLTYVAGDQLTGIVYWTMGNMNGEWNDIAIVAPLIFAGCFVMVSCSRDLNAMMLGDAHAMDLGVEVRKVRIQLLIASALVTAAAVAFVGVIGFVGLVVPHILRILMGPDNRALLPASILGGAAFLLMCDYISRVVGGWTYGILPIGIVTSLIGAPYFIYLLRRRRSEVGWD